MKQREADLLEKNKTLLGLSNSLAALLNPSRTDPEAAETCALAKIGELIDATAARRPGAAQGKIAAHLKGVLDELSAVLKTKSAFVYQCLTPMEIQVANLIRQGQGNKEIADLLGISRRTVEVHRYNIRKKLQLDKSKVNLSTYLSTME